MDLDLSSRMSNWFYIDNNGHAQGPFTSEEMVGWYNAGDLPTNLLLRRGIDSHFSRLDTFPRFFGCAPFDSALAPRMNRSGPGVGYRRPTRQMQPARVPWMNASGAGYEWQKIEMQPSGVPWMNGSGPARAGHKWQTIEMKPAVIKEQNMLESKHNPPQPDHEALQPELPKDTNVDLLRKIKKAFNSTFRSGKDTEISGDETESFQKAKIRIKEERIESPENYRIEIKEELSEMSINTKVKIKKEYIEQEIDSEILESVNVDFKGMIKKDGNMNVCVNNAEEITKQETKSFLITKKESKSHEAESLKNLKEENTETPRKAIKKPSQYDSNLVKVSGRRDRNVSNQYGSGKRKRVEQHPWKQRPKDNKSRVDKSISSSVTNKRPIIRSREAESLRNLKEENTETPRKAVKKPSQYDSNLVKVSGRRDWNVSNQYGSGKRKRVEHRPWKQRPKDNKSRVDKSISSSVTNTRPIIRSKSKSVNSYESDKRQKQGNKNPEWRFYEWKCPRLKCGGIILRRSVICIACQRENPCVGVCRTEGCGQFNWISMMVCPKCHQDDGVP